MAGRSATEVPATWIMKQAFDQNQLAMASRMTVILTVVVIADLAGLPAVFGAGQCHAATETRAQPGEWLQFGVGRA